MKIINSLSIANEYKLDNPVWHSLNETHKDYAIDFNHIKFYKPDYCPFRGFVNGENIVSSIDKYAELTDDFFMVEQKPNFSDILQLKQELICLQMVIDHKIAIKFKDEILELKNEHLNDVFNLVKIAYPHYFKQKTFLLGRYYGIYKNNKLVAITGERMAMNDYVEVSAVITHPKHLGKGYAQQLVTHTVNKIFEQHKTPFLFVAETNTGAIKLYEKLGFKLRRKISFWNLVR